MRELFRKLFRQLLYRLQLLIGKPQNVIKTQGGAETTVSETYWSKHTVHSKPFISASESFHNLDERFNGYPLFRELMDVWGDHEGDVVLDYGCGPGNDLVGFLAYSGAKKVIGIDVSKKALALASQRLWLHRFDPSRFELYKISDGLPKIPLGDGSVDYIYSQGVLHHTSHPESILEEFYRILKPQKSACIMVYNRESIWLHLYTAYDQIILQNAFPGLSLDEAFARNTDGVDCPIARCYSAGEFIDLCQKVGFQTEYMGGYLSREELSFLGSLKDQAIGDERLNRVHRDFLRDLEYDEHGYPLYHGKYAGVGGVYHLVKSIHR